VSSFKAVSVFFYQLFLYKLNDFFQVLSLFHSTWLAVRAETIPGQLAMALLFTGFVVVAFGIISHYSGLQTADPISYNKFFLTVLGKN
jgi:hypothetical protein